MLSVVAIFYGALRPYRLALSLSANSLQQFPITGSVFFNFIEFSYN